MAVTKNLYNLFLLKIGKCAQLVSTRRNRLELDNQREKQCIIASKNGIALNHMFNEKIGYECALVNSQLASCKN